MNLTQSEIDYLINFVFSADKAEIIKDLEKNNFSPGFKNLIKDLFENHLKGE